MTDKTKKKSSISIIAAIAKNKAIGKDGELPWHLSDDLKRFKEITSGHPVIMGRITYESIGKPLPNRTNIIISNKLNQEDVPEGVIVSRSMKECINLNVVKEYKGEIFVIGGSRIYKEALAFASKLYITEIDKIFEADTFFPDIGKEWKISYYEPKENECFRYRFLEYERDDGTQPYILL